MRSLIANRPLMCWRLIPFFLSLLTVASWAQPRHLYLTWDNPDTARTQTVVFHTNGKAMNPRVEVDLDGTGKMSQLQATTVMLTGTQRRVHSVTLQGLKPATTYKFRAGDTQFGMSAWRSFRTLPAQGEEIRIASGGDMYRHPETIELLRAIARYKPHVALIGGDIAYDDGKLQNLPFWDDWFDNWAQNMDPKNGPMVAMICAIGNHEVRGSFERSKKDAPTYFAFFPQGGEPYFVRNLGPKTEVVVLDTGHVTHHKDQVSFLERSLRAMQERNVPFRLALYHVPCYPSHRAFDDTYARRGRQYWVPLFDRYKLSAGLENHDHTFKRTHPLVAGKTTAGGTVYLGDGLWGISPRRAHKLPVHVKASSTYHVWLLSTTPDGLLCQAVGLDGKVFDQTTLKARTKGGSSPGQQ